MKKGFTLIELLVVVLIIGILAASALPGYEVAVGKSRTAQIRALLKTVSAAQQVFYMANGYYTTRFADLDVELPAAEAAECRSTNTDCVRLGDFDLEIFINDSYSGTSVEAAGKDVIIVIYSDEERRSRYGTTTCISRSDLGRKICMALGGKRSAYADNYYKLDE